MCHVWMQNDVQIVKMKYTQTHTELRARITQNESNNGKWHEMSMWDYIKNINKLEQREKERTRAPYEIPSKQNR